MPYCSTCGEKKEKPEAKCAKCLEKEKRRRTVYVLAEYDFGKSMKVASIHKTLAGAKKRQHGYLNWMVTYILEFQMMD